MKIPCVLLVVLVLSSADRASAQQAQPAGDAPRQRLPSPPLVPANDGTSPSSSDELREDAESQEPGFLPRAGIGLLGGIGGGLVGAGAGALLGHVAAVPVGCEDELCRGARLSGAYAGALLGVPAGTYFAGIDVSALGEDDGHAFCLTLPERAGVVAVPMVVFYDDKQAGRSLVRFAFCKRDEVIDEAAARLSRLQG